MAVRIESENCRRATRDKKLQLFFSRAAQFDLALDFFQMQVRQSAAARRCVAEKAGSEEGRERKYDPRDAKLRGPRKRVECFCQGCAKRSDAGDLPPAEAATHHQHWKKVEKSERDIFFEVPIGQRDYSRRNGGPQQDSGPA